MRGPPLTGEESIDITRDWSIEGGGTLELQLGSPSKRRHAVLPFSPLRFRGLGLGVGRLLHFGFLVEPFCVCFCQGSIHCGSRTTLCRPLFSPGLWLRWIKSRRHSPRANGLLGTLRARGESGCCGILEVGLLQARNTRFPWPSSGIIYQSNESEIVGPGRVGKAGKRVH